MRISERSIKDLVENFSTELVFSNIKGKEYQARLNLTEEEYLLWKEIHDRKHNTLHTQKANSIT